MSKALEKIKEFKRKLLSKMLAECTDKQQNFFMRLYPKGVPDHKIREAILLVERTLDKNKRTRYANKV